MFLQSQKFTLQAEVIYHQGIPSFWEYQLLCYSSASQFLPILGLILLKLKHPFNRPVYFRDLCAAYSSIPQKSSHITFQHTYANLLSSKITQHIKFTKDLWKSHKLFPAKNVLKQTTYLLLEAKNPSCLIACVQTTHTHTHNRCHRAIK